MRSTDVTQKEFAKIKQYHYMAECTDALFDCLETQYESDEVQYAWLKPFYDKMHAVKTELESEYTII